MKKVLSFITVLSLFSAELYALSRTDDVGYMTFKYGLTTIEDDLSFNQHSFGADFIGELGYEIKPKLDFTYVNIDESDSVDFLFQTSINAFYKSNYGYQSIVPYFYGGLGYEYVSGARDDFDSSFYLQEALGIEIPISQPADDLHIVTELRFMQMIGTDDGQDSEMALFIGLRLPMGKTLAPYGYSEPPSTTGIYPEVEEEALNHVEEESTSFDDYTIDSETSNTKVTRSIGFGDEISDEDGDGVEDSLDSCPNTPPNLAVDEQGCPIKDTNIYPSKRSYKKSQPIKSASFKALPNTTKILDVHFKLNSAQIEPSSRDVIRRFVEAVNRTHYSTIVVKGYTDNTGSYEHNIALSQKRAEAVKRLMIQYGIDSNSIKAVGKGPLSPIAPNETEEGRALNRRIEIVVN